MTRQINEPIRVFLDRAGAAPTAFLWGDRRYRVRRVEACWKQVGSWWDDEGERTFFRVSAIPEARDAPPPTEGVYELTHDHTSGRWSLAGVLD
jgi:Family of unknown function (DUF6504)